MHVKSKLFVIFLLVLFGASSARASSLSFLQWVPSYILYPVDPEPVIGKSPYFQLSGSEHLRTIAFDLDGTLLSTHEAFILAKKKGLRKTERAFFEWVNSEAMIRRAPILEKGLVALRFHQRHHQRVIIVTARSPYGKQPVIDRLGRDFQINPEDIYFETNGKAARLRAENVELMYGDSDSDIEAALEAGAHPVRVLRINLEDGPSDYNVGKYREDILR